MSDLKDFLRESMEKTDCRTRRRDPRELIQELMDAPNDDSDGLAFAPADADDHGLFSERLTIDNADEVFGPDDEGEENRDAREGCRQDEQFCEVSPPGASKRSGGGVRTGLDGRPLPEKVFAAGGEYEEEASEEKTFYPPQRAPPIVDFVTVVTAFLVAVFAAYYSISA